MPKSYKKLSPKKCMSKMVAYLENKHDDWSHEKCQAVAAKECGVSKGDTISQYNTDFKKASEMSYEECISSRSKKIRETHPDYSDEKVKKMAKERCQNSENLKEDIKRGAFQRCQDRLKYMGYSPDEARLICSTIFIEDTKLFGEKEEPTKEERLRHDPRYDPRTRHSGGHPTHVEIGVKPRPLALPIQAPHRSSKDINIMRTKLEKIQTLEERFLNLEQLLQRAEYQKEIGKEGKSVKGQKKFTLPESAKSKMDSNDLKFYQIIGDLRQEEESVKDTIKKAINENHISVQYKLEDDQKKIGEEMSNILDSSSSITQDEAFARSIENVMEIEEDRVYGGDTFQIDSVNNLNNVLKVPVTMAKEMVQAYHKDSGEELHYKPYGELKRAAQKTEEVPIIIEHNRFSDNDIVGKVKEIYADDPTSSIKGTAYITKSRLPTPVLDAIEGDEPFGVSIGFFADIGGGGEYNGVIYDKTQRNIVINHLALCVDSSPRCPVGECGINVDSLPNDKENDEIGLISKENYYYNIQANLEEKSNLKDNSQRNDGNMGKSPKDQKQIFSKLGKALKYLHMDNVKDAVNLLNQIIDEDDENDKDDEEKEGEKPDEEKKGESQMKDSKVEELQSQIQELQDSLEDKDKTIRKFREKERRELKDSIMKFSVYTEDELSGKSVDELNTINDAVSRFNPSERKARKPKPKAEESFEDSGEEYTSPNPENFFEDTNKRFGM